MTNTLPGPDKGLLDVLFGNKPSEASAAQAVLPGENAGEASASLEDFMKLVTQMQQAQDQKVAPQADNAMALPKDGELTEKKKFGAQATQADADATTTTMMIGAPSESAIPTAQVRAQAQIKTKDRAKAVAKAVSDETLPSEKNLKKEKNAKADAGFAEGQTVAVALAAQPAVIAAKTDAKSDAGVSAEATVRREAMEVVAKPNVARPVAARANAAQELMARPPEASRFEVIDAEEAGATSSPTAAPMLSSQDFVARRAAILGSDRTDSLDLGFSQERTESANKQREDFSLLMPQVVSQTGSELASTRAEGVAVNASHLVDGAPAGRKVDVSNPLALASQVGGLMARGGGTVRLRVAPENLGEMTISVQTRGRQLEVRFEAASNEARQALNGALPELREALSAQRYDVRSIEVSQSSPTSDGTSGTLGALNGWSANAVNSNGGSSLAQWAGGDRSNGDSSQNGSAWERFNAQQEAYQQRQQQSGGRQNQGYRRYQEYELGA